jgi:TolA-binding protein
LIDQQPPPKRRDAALYRLAWILADQKQAEAAATRFRQLVDEHPDSEYFADALYRCAERAARMQHTDEAARMLAQLLKTPGPEEIRMHALYLQGQLAATAGRWEDVLPPMQRLLSEFPESKLQQPATYWIAEARFRQQEYTEADAWFSQIGTGEDAREWLAMVAVRRAQIRLHAQDWDAAYEMASEIEQRFPEFRQQYEADFVVGRCLAMRARFDEARERYERVIRSPSGGRTETAAMAQWMIGESYLHQKQYDQALRAFARVESLYAYPRWQAAALLQAGKCLQHQGDREQAARCFSRVVSEYPQSTFAEEAEQRLAGSEPAAREASGSSTHRVTDQANLQ